MLCRSDSPVSSIDVINNLMTTPWIKDRISVRELFHNSWMANKKLWYWFAPCSAAWVIKKEMTFRRILETLIHGGNSIQEKWMITHSFLYLQRKDKDQTFESLSMTARCNAILDNLRKMLQEILNVITKFCMRYLRFLPERKQDMNLYLHSMIRERNFVLRSKYLRQIGH